MTGDQPKLGENTRNRGNAGKGRPKGVPNKTTVVMKDAITAVYSDLQAETGKDNGHFLDWAKSNPTEFYKIAAKLIPMAVDANVAFSPLPAKVDDFV